MHTQYNNNNTVMNHGYQQSLCQLTVKELKQTDALLVRQIILSMRTCFFLSRTHTHHKNTHTHTCMLETADGERNRLTFYRKEKNGGGR